MNTDTRNVVIFRGLIITFVVLWLVSVFGSGMLEDPITRQVSDFSFSVHAEPEMSFGLFMASYVMHLMLLAVAVVGMWFFWSPSRWLLVSSPILAYLTLALDGAPTSVAAFYHNMLGDLTDWAFGALLALSFVGPIAKKFMANNIEGDVT